MYMVHLSQKSPENCHASYHACCSINLTTGMGVCGYLGNIWVNIGPGPLAVMNIAEQSGSTHLKTIFKLLAIS